MGKRYKENFTEADTEIQNKHRERYSVSLIT